ncbi:FAD-dependent oxidoreductase [Eubacterium oxidoreducens]|uniref:NADPH-dependent 2,4-dienoyl-CoA reductase, sulfur reductase n=1 Tax=Eubacterium oxidoreducens TaxID=1732 RepID=A0A1G6A4Y2_EUBOX|nr:FAD-dependent oxidoreductase [Eubacterium oxidoreducens]SDB03326.1 NADPH-dependent 2,4-dienoyl-CoA reductase, sulfur reductase [Eubacterium oxidoreducens]
MGKTVIIGGVAAGASCAARLRRLKEEEEIVLLERGEYISYANCGLPYHVGEVIEERDNLLVMKKQVMVNRFKIDVRDKSEAIGIDTAKKQVTIREASGNEYQESYDNLLIATGSSPYRPNVEGIDSDKVKSLWTVSDTDEIKGYIKNHGAKSVVVIGGGFIGLEMAENLHQLGLEVTIVQSPKQVMKQLDFEMAKILHRNIEKHGVKLILEDGVAGFSDCGDHLTITLRSKTELNADFAVLSIGVRANSDIAKEAKIAVNEDGGIVVDDRMRTSAPCVYAAGDVVEVKDYVLGGRTMVPLAGPANKQGRIVADNIAGIASSYKGTQGSFVIQVFDFTASSTGVNEKTLIAKGYVKGKDYETVFITQNSHAGYYPGAKPLYVKLIFSMDGKKIYGAQVVGQEGADKRIDTIAAAMQFGASVKDLANLELAYAPPYSSAKDPVNMAGYVAENVINGYVRLAEWNELETNQDAVVLDVREKPELQTFAFDGAIHIPLGQLRDRIGELDRGKEYIVMCGIGVRAYNASRILAQHGITKTKVYPGGVKYYRAIH